MAPCLSISYRDLVISRNFEEHELTYEQWKSVLHLSTRWGFVSLRKLALRSIKPPTPHDQLILARTYSVEHWVLPSLTALCSRTLPLSLGEARQMSMEDVILVATLREGIRGEALRVDATDIPRHVAEAEVEAQQAKLEDETKGIADAEAREKREAEAKTKAEVNAKVAEEAKIKAADEAKAVAAKAELEAKKNTEKRRLEIETRSKIEAMKAKAEEERKRAEVERADSRAKQDEQIARQRAADKAARAASASSSTSSLLSRITASITASAVNASSPSTELDPLRGPRDPCVSVQHPSTTSSPPRESVSTQSMMPTTAVRPLASVVTSLPSLAWQERKLTTDKQDGKWFCLSFLGQVDNGIGIQAAAAFPAEASADVQKSETAVATTDNPVPSNTTDVSRTYRIVGGTTASDAQADKHANYAPTPPKAECTRAPETAPTEVGVSSRHNNDLDPGPASALPLPPVMLCQPCLVPGDIALQMSQPHMFLRRIPPEKDATVTKEHTAPTPDSAALVYAGPETPTPNVLDAKNAGESPEAFPAARQDSVKPDGAAAKPTLRLSQHSEADGCGSSITKGGEANPERPVKPTLRLDCMRGVSTASAMTTSGSGVPIDDAPSSWLEKKNDSDASGIKLTKAQQKRIREKARKQAQRGEESSPRPPFWATRNNLSVYNSATQEPKSTTTAPVYIPAGKGESECVDAETEREGGKDGARAIVEKHDAAAATTEAAATHAAYGDQW